MTPKRMISLAFLLLIVSIPLFAYGIGQFSSTGDGTVIDQSAGKMWQSDYSEGKAWRSAMAYCENLSLNGHEDWHLPTIDELETIVDREKNNPAINTRFFRSASEAYWSQSNFDVSSDEAWVVFFDSGLSGFGSKGRPHCVRCVRDVR